MKMKYLKNLTFGLILILTTACASTKTTAEKEAELTKYEFENLTTVSRILNWSLGGWSSIDNRSLIVQTSPSKYYLFVLARSNTHLTFAESIIISSTGGSVKAKFDTVSTLRYPMMKTSIEKIYQLVSKEQVADIIQKIKGE